MTPSEKACRALCKLDGHPENITFEGRPMWQSYTPQVKAVIEALRDPSDAMMTAGITKGQEIGYTDIIGVWKAMLYAVEIDGAPKR